MYDNSCNYKDRCSCADTHKTVVAFGSMEMSFSLVMKLYHSIWKPITDDISTTNLIPISCSWICIFEYNMKYFIMIRLPPTMYC